MEQQIILTPWYTGLVTNTSTRTCFQPRIVLFHQGQVLGSGLLIGASKAGVNKEDILERIPFCVDDKKMMFNHRTLESLCAVQL